MDSKEEVMFLENIEEFVMDEGKMVTYKWLSRTFDIHVNAAKQLLYTYALPNGCRKPDVYITYLVGGTLNDGCGVKIQVCREDERDEVKSQFQVVNFEHIYSIQKSARIPDLNILYGIDNEKMKQMSEERLGAIICKKAMRRRDNDIMALRVEAIAATAVATKTPGFACKEPHRGTPGIVRPDEKNTDDVKSVEPEKAKTIASMFTAQSKKPPMSNGKSAIVNNTAKKGNGRSISSFFSKQPEQVRPTERSPTENSVTDKKMTIREATDKPGTAGDKGSPTQDSVTNKMTIGIREATDKPDTADKKAIKIEKSEAEATDKPDTADKKAIKIEKSEAGSKKKKKTASAGRKPDKKRKRIMVMSDSDSSDDDIFGKDDDDIFGKDDDDIDMSPASPEDSHRSKSDYGEEDVIPPTPVQNGSGKVRIGRRKLVDKTFMDEEGFVVTKKEMVYESCSEEEKESEMAGRNKEKDAAESKEMASWSKKHEKEATVNIIVEQVKEEKKANKSANRAIVENKNQEKSSNSKEKKGTTKNEEPSTSNLEEEVCNPREKKNKLKKKEVMEEAEEVSTGKKTKRKKKEVMEEAEEDSTGKKTKRKKKEVMEEAEEGKKTKRKKKEITDESQEENQDKKKKKVTPPASIGKQQTLMSFFSKK